MKLLVVGAGGIGCELLKNLVLVGCENIVTVDLDTIDVSNLNRQFLFRKHHVGQPKALVARDAVARFNPRASVEAHHANIKEARFGLAWFGEFACVVNALDNVDARRHVNRMCLASEVPLIEAGTTGFLGQVFVIAKGSTACYECFPKATQVVYPICTIRSTPDKPVHCIVWAKELYKLLFGNAKDSMLWEDDSVDASTYIAAALAAREATTPTAAAHAIGAALVALCDDEVRKQISMDKYKTAKSAPTPLDAATIRSACVDEAVAAAPSTRKVKDWDRAVWTTAECASEIAAVGAKLCVGDARERLGTHEFDKDDALAMLFVSAAANLRSSVFGIELQSLYACKGIAGNIIPAIATTNAIVAGLQVAELLKLVVATAKAAAEGGKPNVRECCSYMYCLRAPSRKGHLLQPTTLDEPQKACYVCRAGRVAVAIDTTSATLRHFVDTVVVGKLGFVTPAIDAADSGLYDKEDDRLEANLEKALAELPAGGVVDGTILSVTDYATDLEISLIVRHRDAADFDAKLQPEGFELLTGAAADDPPPLAAPAAPAADAAQAATEEPAPADAHEPPTKRSRPN